MYQKHPVPLQKIEDQLLDQKAITLYLKREDRIHSRISGNKWHKLKYNLEKAKNEHHTTLLTFGGAYSNHIYAVAALGQEFNLQTIGLIRGEAHLPLNPTLQFARDQGMRLDYLDRSTYRQKNADGFIQSLVRKYGHFYLIPEGGSNELAVRGCAEIPQGIRESFDYLCTPAGTGGTLAGLIAGVGTQQIALGFSALKGGDFLRQDITSLLDKCGISAGSNWKIVTDYHFGGYARHQPELIHFINQFKQVHGIPLDPVYTGKMMYGLFDLIQNDYFPPRKTIVALHTGGLQGIAGFNQRFGQLID
ncbi:MAG: 1-aminocyclopropane-1-carboxylate deaminase/D-cysteine desulfhydrase [Candidatus Cyclobacteriaceae bacterium M3_2C_046]